MEENLEVFFCDICNTSVPARDLEIGAALRVKGKTIGGCCLPAPRKADGLRGAAAGRGMAMSLALLAAVAGAAVFLDWRLTEEMAVVGGEVASLGRDLGDQRQQLLAVEERLDSTALRNDVASLKDAISTMAAGMGDDEPLSAAVDGIGATLARLEQGIVLLQSGQDEGSSLVSTLQTEVQSVARRVEELNAMAPAHPAEPAGATTPAVDAAADVGLPASLRHQMSRLTDEDPGTRFEAVDELLRSKSPLVLEALLPMTRDPDAFVRRLTVEGLSDFRDAACVDSLLASLADPEAIVRSTAYLSLKKLTGESFPFDPDASRDVRVAAQQRWQDWWQQARDSFGDR